MYESKEKLQGRRRGLSQARILSGTFPRLLTVLPNFSLWGSFYYRLSSVCQVYRGYRRSILGSDDTQNSMNGRRQLIVQLITVYTSRQKQIKYGFHNKNTVTHLKDEFILQTQNSVL